MRVGFVGLGSQGAPMAEMIAAAGLPLTVWARRAVAVEPFARAGAAVADDLVAVGRASDVVGVCVVDDAGVDEVCRPLLDGLTPGATIAVHSTVRPDTVERLAVRSGDVGVSVLDAPVMGGAAAARNRSLMVVAGGDADVVERCRPMLEAYADPIVHVGPVGAGQVAKLLFNLLFVVNVEVHERVADLAVRLGIDRSAAAAVLGQLRASSFAPRLIAREIAPAALEHSAAILTKDVGHVLDILGDAAVDTAPLDELARGALDTLRRMAAGSDSGH